MLVHRRPVAVWVKDDFGCNRQPLRMGTIGGYFLGCSDIGGKPGVVTFCSFAYDLARSEVYLLTIFTLPTCVDRNLDCRCIILPIMYVHSDILLEMVLWMMTRLPFSE